MSYIVHFLDLTLSSKQPSLKRDLKVAQNVLSIIEPAMRTDEYDDIFYSFSSKQCTTDFGVPGGFTARWFSSCGDQKPLESGTQGGFGIGGTVGRTVEIYVSFGGTNKESC